jgi:hypothetical protein
MCPEMRALIEKISDDPCPPGARPVIYVRGTERCLAGEIAGTMSPISHAFGPCLVARPNLLRQYVACQSYQNEYASRSLEKCECLFRRKRDRALWNVIQLLGMSSPHGPLQPGAKPNPRD